MSLRQLIGRIHGVWRENPSCPWRPLGPEPTRGGDLGRGSESRLGAGFGRNVPSPTLSAPSFSPGAEEKRPSVASASVRPPRPARQGLRAPAVGHTRKIPGPRVRPRHPPDRPRDSAARVRAAPPSAPALPSLKSRDPSAHLAVRVTRVTWCLLSLRHPAGRTQIR